jgi:hypothetical protein
MEDERRVNGELYLEDVPPPAQPLPLPFDFTLGKNHLYTFPFSIFKP